MFCNFCCLSLLVSLNLVPNVRGLVYQSRLMFRNFLSCFACLFEPCPQCPAATHQRNDHSARGSQLQGPKEKATKVSNRNALILENERCARLPLASTLARCVPRGSHQLVKQCLFGFYRAPRCIQDISVRRDEGSKLLAMCCRELRQSP